jgi:hypothetical protein
MVDVGAFSPASGKAATADCALSALDGQEEKKAAFGEPVFLFEGVLFIGLSPRAFPVADRPSDVTGPAMAL